jgi:SAM-dependent methyltransferase
MTEHPVLKQRVHAFWNQGACGEIYAAGASEAEQFATQSMVRYALEPYLADFARFATGHGRDVLEIGVGMGADHVEWARCKPRSLTGIDLTERAVELTRRRLTTEGLCSDLHVADAEALPFGDESFDLVYSWGVVHHSPDTTRAVQEIYRVLRRGGQARVMIYHTYSLVGYMLWARYGMLRGRPWRCLADIYANHLESPGTKAYRIGEAKALFNAFTQVAVRPQLSFGDLLEGGVGQRHRGMLLTLAKKLYPRPLIRRACKNHGLYLLIEGEK